MDIAEIRKKARTGRGRSQSPEVTTETFAVPVTTAAAEPPAVPPAPPTSARVLPSPSPVAVPATVNAPSAADESGVTALEALFNWSAEQLLASDESYRQGLQLLSEENEEEICQWLTFSLGAEEYALDITSIREIIKPREITDIPRVPDFLLGIISLRGTIIPVFDLQSRLKLGRGSIGADSRIIVCQHEERAAGLLVDRIAQVVNLPIRSIEPPPAVLTGLDRELVAGVGRHQGKMMVLLQLSNVLNAELY